MFWVFPLTSKVSFGFQKKLKSEFQKNILSSFNLGLIRFGYRGAFFLFHAISFVVVWR